MGTAIALPSGIMPLLRAGMLEWKNPDVITVRLTPTRIDRRRALLPRRALIRETAKYQRPLVPPKPKELESTTSMSRFLA